MRKRHLSVLILAALLLLGVTTVYAQGPEDGDTMLLLLPVPQSEDLTLGEETVEAYTHRTAQPVLEQLAQMERRGQIDGFDLLYDRHAVRVTTIEAEALRELNGIDGILPLDEAGLTCATTGARAVEDTLEAARVAPMAPASTQATNPSITVYYRGDYGRVSGQTDPNTTVQMVLKDAAGAVKATETTSSYSSGYYSFYPEWQRCVGYDWHPQPGDTVEVTAGGNTVSTVVADISAFPDPGNDTVTGQTAPNHTVRVSADSTRADCDYTSASATTTSDGNGDFAAIVDQGFDRSVSVSVYVDDANDNTTYTYFYPPHIALDSEGNPSGTLKPTVSYTASLMRGGSSIATFSGITTEEGRYGGSFPKTVQAGDVIEVSGGGETITTPFAALTDLTFDLANDRITGNVGSGAAGRSMRIAMDRPWYVCKDDGSCVVDTVEGDGGFTFDFGADGFDLERGDEDSPTIFDAEGNYQEFRDELVVPIVIVETRQHTIRGNWREPNAEITMTLRGAGGAVKETDTDTTSSYDSGFYFWGTSVEPGDRVDVTDGTYTLTISSVPTLTAYLDSAADTVSGTGPEGSTLVVKPWQFRLAPDYLSWSSWLCYTDTVSGGRYSVGFGSQFDAKARDYATVYHTTSEGHKVSAQSYALTVDAEKGDNRVEGYTPAPGTEVLVELWRGGSSQAVFTTTSSSSGGYSGSFYDGTPVIITQGDTVKVKPEGISTYSLSIPELTVQEDAAQNEVEGRAPANAALKVRLDQPATWYDWGVLTTADANGDYVASFDGVYEYDCTAARVGACTQPGTTYYNDDGHSVTVWGPEPAGVSADEFEPDGVYTRSSSYAGVQSHTFHVVTDTDWIRFTVTAEDVGSVTYLQTTNLGINANTKLYLYDTDGTTPLESDVSYSPASSEIVWTPSVSGTYYVNVEPYHDSYAGDCGSTYDFFIARHRVYLPLVIRNQ